VKNNNTGLTIHCDDCVPLEEGLAGIHDTHYLCSHLLNKVANQNLPIVDLRLCSQGSARLHNLALGNNAPLLVASNSLRKFRYTAHESFLEEDEWQINTEAALTLANAATKLQCLYIKLSIRACC